MRLSRLKPDTRVERTTERLREALVHLIVERGYENTTVGHILDRARCGRATFYSHFRGKEDLLRSILRRLHGKLTEKHKPAPAGHGKSGMRLDFTLSLFREFAGYRHVYKAIDGRESGVIIRRQLRRILADLIREDLRAHRAIGAASPLFELEVQYCAGALMSVLTWWLDNNLPLSPEQLSEVFAALVNRGLAPPQRPGLLDPDARDLIGA